jgi:hypothetical protein
LEPLEWRIADNARRLDEAGLPGSFCPMPWIHAYADPQGDVRPCCWYEGDLPGRPNLAGMSGMDDVMHGDGMAMTRAAFLRGETPDACMACKRREAQGQYSKRMRGIGSVTDDELRAFAAGPADGSIDSYELRHFDFRFDNTCNFRCRTCGPINSSRIESEERSQGIEHGTGGFDRARWHAIFGDKIDGARSVYLAGGEPLIMDSTYDILQRLVDVGNTDVELSCSTNLSQLSRNGRRMFDLLRSFVDTRICVSADHYGDKAAYIRSGTDWEQLVSNYRLLRTSCPHVKVQIDCVVSVLNILDITDIIDRFRMTFDSSPINLLPVQGKIHFKPANLPYSAKQVAIERITGWCNANPHDHGMVSSLRALCHDMEQQGRSDSPAKFMEQMSRLDSLRGEDISVSLPELSGFYAR